MSNTVPMFGPVILCVVLLGQVEAGAKPLCTNHLIEENCLSIAGVCTNIFAKDICPKYCNLCDDLGSSLTVTTPSPVIHTTLPPCSDHLIEDRCPTVKDVCSNVLADKVCPRFCGLCDPNKTVLQTTLPPCSDHLIEDRCPTVKDVCSNVLADKVCPRFCGLCDPNKTATLSSTTQITPTTAITTLTTTLTMTSTTSTSTSTTSATTTTSTCLDPPHCCEDKAICSNNPLAPVGCPNTCPAQITTTTPRPPLTTTTTTVPSSSAGGHSAVIRKCYQCGDPQNNVPCTYVDLVVAQPTDCPAGSYCMTDVVNSADGTSSEITKRCVQRLECSRKWYTETSDVAACMNYDETNLVPGLTCHFCCKDDDCNAGIVPAKPTLWKP